MVISNISTKFQRFIVFLTYSSQTVILNNKEEMKYLI